MEDKLKYKTFEKLGSISLNRWKNNPLDYDLLNSLAKAIEKSKENKDLCLIIRAEGNNFTVGADLKYVYKKLIKENDLNAFYKFGEAFQELTRQMINYPGLIIMCLKGWVIGGGFELSLAADIRLATESTKIKLPELSIGTMFSNASTKLLPELIGLAKAKELMLLGREITGKEALNIGLVNFLFSDDDLDTKANQIAQEFIQHTSEEALESAKLLLIKNNNLNFEQTLINELQVMNKLAKNSLFQEKIRSFVEK